MHKVLFQEKVILTKKKKMYMNCFLLVFIKTKNIGWDKFQLSLPSITYALYKYYTYRTLDGLK